MSEEEIRLDQTKRVFDTLAELISKNETCTYRYLIYDLLGFDGYYSTLISGLTITNALVEKEDLQQKVEQLEIENEQLRTQVNTYENPDDLTLFYMWLDEKAKDKIKQLEKENIILEEKNKQLEILVADIMTNEVDNILNKGSE